MKLFLDTAEVAAIRRASATGLLDGVTTNPSHVARPDAFLKTSSKRFRNGARARERRGRGGHARGTGGGGSTTGGIREADRHQDSHDAGEG